MSKTKSTHETCSARISMFLSIITINRNNAEGLKKTLDSVASQTCRDFEHIIIDGASSDDSVEIIKNYVASSAGKNVSNWVSEPDSGIYNAMNKGIKKATGQYIALLNSGDWYEPDTCKIISETAKESQNDVYYGLLRYINKNNKCEMVLGRTVEMLKNCMIAHPTCFISKNIYSKYLYDENYKYAADYDLILRIYESGSSFYFIEKILANFNTYGISSSYKANKESLMIQKKHNLITPFVYLYKILYLYVFFLIKGICRL